MINEPTNPIQDEEPKDPSKIAQFVDKAVTKVSDPNFIAPTLKVGNQIGEFIGILWSAIFLAFTILFYNFTNVLQQGPNWLGIIVVAVGALFVVLSIVRLIRVSKTNMAPAKVGSADNAITISPDEKVKDYVVGILRTGTNYPGVGLRGVSILGAGKVYQPENAFIVTNKQIVFVVVPASGAGVLLDSNFGDIGEDQFLVSKKHIESTLKNLLETASLADIAKTNKLNFAMPLDGTTIDMGGSGFFSTLTIKFTCGKKAVRYSIRDRADFARAKEIFGK